MDPTDDSEAIVVRLVERCLDLIAEARDAHARGAALDELLAGNPQHAPAVRRRLRALRAAGLIDDGPAGRAAGRGPTESGPNGSGPQQTDGGPGALGFPERLGEFRLLRRIGAGGMGVVYLAEQTSLGRQVALKVIRPEHLFFPEAKARFRREVESVARLDHPGIVPIHTFGEERGIPYFAMEYVAGASLDQLLTDLAGRSPRQLDGDALAAALSARTGAPGGAVAGFAKSWTDACFGLAVQVADSLEHAHRRGVLHRDVKPSNIMVTADGRARLLDFGLARSEDAHALTRTGSQLGSLPYMAPEQCRGEHVDARTDVHAVGVTLYEMLTLASPHWHDTAEATRQSILVGEPTPIRERNPSVAWDAETVCSKAMDRDPQRRYSSAAELADDMRRYLRREAISGRRPGALLRLRRWSQRHPASATALAFGSLAVASTIAYLVDARRSDSDLREANAEERAQRERAEQSLEDAIAATDEMLEQGSDSELANTPGSDPARKRLLETALQLYQRLLERENAAPLAWRIVDASTRIGELHRQLGRRDEAVAALRAALDGIDERLAQAIDVAEARRRRVPAELALVTALVEAGRHREAIERADRIAAELGADPAPAPITRGRRAEAWQLAAVAHAGAGDIDAAIAAIDLAIAERTRLQAERPDDRTSVAALSRALQTKGYWIGFFRRDEPYAEWFERARELLELTIATDDGPEPRVQLASLLGSWVGVDLARGQRSAAIARLREALGQLDDLVHAYPARVPYLESWLASQHQLGWAMKDGDALQAANELRHGVARGREFVARQPGHLGLEYRLAVLETELARVLGGDHEDEARSLFASAAARWQRVVSDPDANPNHAQFAGVFHDQRARFEEGCGRLEDALAEAEQACARHRSEIVRMPRVTSHRDHLASSLTLKARLLAGLSRPDDALRTLAEAVDEAGLDADRLAALLERLGLAARSDAIELLARAPRAR